MDDMDMDIPLPEELEFLESNSHFAEQQEEEDRHYYFPDLDPTAEIHESNSQQSPPPPDLAAPSAEPESSGHKRSCPPSPSPPEEEKRAKVRVAVEEDSSAAAADEDWLRYSPPPVPEGEPAVEEMAFEKEKTLSRYASEIDGECMPITAPSGNRVYAKLNRFQGEERVTKLDYNGYSTGTFFFSLKF